MKNASKATEKPANGKQPASDPGQIVLVFQGGGALGAYQAGVYQALHEAGIEPDWIIGTSIAFRGLRIRQWRGWRRGCGSE